MNTQTQTILQKLSDFEDECGMGGVVHPRTGKKKKTQVQALKEKLAMSRQTAMAQGGGDASWRAQQMTAQGPVTSTRPVRDPQTALAHQQMMQDPRAFTMGGVGHQLPASGLELDRTAHGTQTHVPAGWGQPKGGLKRASELEKLAHILREKLAIAPLIGAGLMAAGRAAPPMIGRAMASPVGNMVGQQAVGMGMQAGANAMTAPKKLPGQIGG